MEEQEQINEQTPQTEAAQPAESWRTTLPAEIREADDFKQIGSVTELANAYLAVKKHVLTGNEMGDTPESKSAFFTKYGKPAAETGYTFELPDEIKGDEDVNAFTDVLRKAAFAGNLTDEQFSAVMESVLNQPAVFEQKENEEKAQRNRIMNEYAVKCGADFNRKMADLNTICNSVGEEFVNELIKAGAGFNPVIIEGLLRLGDAYIEKSGGLYRSDGAPVLTGKEIDSQVAKLRADPAFLDAGNPRHKSVVSQIDALCKQKFAP